MVLTPKSLGARRLWRVGQQEPGGRLKLPSLRLPERLPDLRRPWLTLFEIFWFAALLLAIAGPIAGLYYRFTTPGENSALMLGSRTGLVLSGRRSDSCPLSDRRSGLGRPATLARPPTTPGDR